MGRTDTIRINLKSIGEDYDRLKPFMQEYLKQTEEIIAQKRKNQESAITDLKGCQLSLSTISKELGCSRTTLYNHNQLIKRYIELVVQDFDKENPYRVCEDLKDKLFTLQKEIGLMYDRDIDVEILKQENKSLHNIIKDMSKEIDRLRNRVSELATENHLLKADNRSEELKGTILQFNNKG